MSKETPTDSDNDTTCAELKADEGFKAASASISSDTLSRSTSRPISLCSEPERKWVDAVTGEL